MKHADKLIQSKLKDFEADVPEGLWGAIEQRLPARKVATMWNRYARYAAAAILVTACTLGGYLLMQPHNTDMAAVRPASHVEITEVENAIPDTRHLVLAPEPIAIDTSRDNKVRTKTDDFFATQQPVVTTEKTVTTSATPVTHETGAPQHNNESQEAPMPTQSPIRRHTTSGTTTLASVYTPKKSTDSETRYAIGIISSNTFSGTQYAQDTRMTRSELYHDKPILKYNHKVPISAGITFEKQFGKHWGIETGVVYTLLRSDYKAENLKRKGKQELHYIGVPFLGRYRIYNTRLFDFYVSAGPRIDFNIYGRRADTTQDAPTYSTYTENIRDQRVQWSAHLKAGVSYIISRHFDLYAEPAIAYYFDNGNGKIANLWKDTPISFNFHLGFRTKF